MSKKFFIHSFSMITLALGLGFSTSPANAQYIGSDSHEAKAVQSVADKSEIRAPINLDPPGLATIIRGDSKAADEITVISGAANMTGTVRVNNLAMLEAVINIGANGAEIVCFLWGAGLLVACFRNMKKPGLGRSIAFAMIPIILGLCTPASINWAMNQVRDVDLFS